MKKKLYIIFSCFLLSAMVVFSAVNNVSAEEVSRAAGYDKSFSYNGSVQTYIVPASGYYKLEVWGAQGGGTFVGKYSNEWSYGGNGGYSVGYQYFNGGQTLYIVIGGKGNDFNESTKAHYTEGYNGGGAGGAHGNPGWGGAGGGATHIATALRGDGTLVNYASAAGNVLIVAGGGGGGATLLRDRDDEGAEYYRGFNGGRGGGLQGEDGAHEDAFGYYAGLGGWQTQRSSSHSTASVGTFGRGASGGVYCGGGGGGWYGGGNNQQGTGGGGSGYIGGCLSKLTYSGSTYTSSTAVSSNTGNGRAAITYLGPIYYRQAVQVSYENADGTFTDYENVISQDYGEGSTFTWTREADGTYQEASISYTVTAAKTSQITVYRKQYMLALEKGTGVDTVCGEGEYRAGQTVTIEAELMEGYEFNGWSESETLIETESTYEFEMPTNDTHYTAVAVPIEYSITYDLAGGVDGGKNPIIYTVESEDIVLEQPTKDGYGFLGWSGSNGSSYQKSVLIPKGSTGDKTYGANWEENEPESGSEDNNTPEGEAENESEGGGSPLPTPTPIPTPTPTRTPKLSLTLTQADGESDDEEGEAESQELTPMPPEGTAVPVPIVKEEGTADVPAKHMGGSNSESNDNSFWKIAAAIAGAGIIGGMIFLALFLFYRKCDIYDAQTEELIGRSIIWKDRRGIFGVRISDSVCEKAGMEIYLVFGENFVRSHREKLLKISVRGKEFYRQIQEKIDFSLKK